MYLNYFEVSAEQGLLLQVWMNVIPCKTTITQRNATIRKLSTAHYGALKIW